MLDNIIAVKSVARILVFNAVNIKNVSKRFNSGAKVGQSSAHVNPRF